MAIEFLIVVLGVFMGLQAQDWNQQRRDRIKARVYVKRLAEDFATLERDLQRCLSVHRGSVDAIKRVSRVVVGNVGIDSPVVEDPDLFKTALLQVTAGAIPAGRSATFIEMLSNGDLSVLRDTKLRRTLITYDERAQANREIWRSFSGGSLAYGRPLYDNVELDVNLDQETISAIREYDLKSMSRDPGFHYMLKILAATKGNSYELCRYQLGLVDRVRQSLARQPEG